jgi:hypothetical protein
MMARLLCLICDFLMPVVRSSVAMPPFWTAARQLLMLILRSHEQWPGEEWGAQVRGSVFCSMMLSSWQKAYLNDSNRSPGIGTRMDFDDFVVALTELATRRSQESVSRTKVDPDAALRSLLRVHILPIYTDKLQHDPLFVSDVAHAGASAAAEEFSAVFFQPEVLEFLNEHRVAFQVGAPKSYA